MWVVAPARLGATRPLGVLPGYSRLRIERDRVVERVGPMSSEASQAQILRDQEAARQASWPTEIPRKVEYAHGQVPLTEYLRWRAAIHGEKPVLHFYGTDVSYAQLDHECDAIAAYLIQQGVRPGDRVALVMQNCPQYLAAFWGTLRAGAVVVPINPMFKEAECRHELNDSGAILAFVQSDYAGLVSAVRAQTDLRHVVTTSISAYASEDSAIRKPFGTTAEDPQADASWSDAIATDSSSTVFPEPDLDALAALNYTGGTTGMPKGCEHTQRHMLYTAATSATVRGTLERGADTGDAVSLCFLPVFWIAGENLAVVNPIYSGATCVLLTRWDPTAVLQCIGQFRVSAMSGTVDNYLELIDHPDLVKHDLSSLHAPSTMSLVSKLTPLIRQQWRDRVGPLSVLREGSYGMTETHTSDTFVTGFQEDDADLTGPPTFVGLPMPDTEIRICDFETREVLPSNVEGEIVVRSPSVMNGYWRNPAASAAALNDGWFHTGDLGLIRDDGCLRYIGRRKEMIKVNGMSVFPSELESLLSEHPALGAVAVVGVPDAERGERPRAYVELYERRDASPDELAAWARGHVASYKVPEFVIVDRLPRTATGKIRKVDLTGGAESPATECGQPARAAGSA